MGHKLCFFLTIQQKEGIKDYFVTKQIDKPFMDWVTDYFIKWLVMAKNNINSAMLRGKIELTNMQTRELMSQTEFSDRVLEHEPVRHDKGFKIEGSDYKKHIFDVGDITYRALEEAYKWQNITNREMNLKVVPSVEELFHNVVVQEVNRCINTTYESELKEEFKLLKKEAEKEAENKATKKIEKENKK